MKTYTKAEKRAYYSKLQKRWKEIKELADNDQTAQALFEATGGNHSYYSFYFTLLDMRAQGLEGLPYIDCKTFDGWKQSGYLVKKGEVSKINGIVWIRAQRNTAQGTYEEIDGAPLFPKMYHLFHTSQVNEL